MSHAWVILYTYCVAGMRLCFYHLVTSFRYLPLGRHLSAYGLDLLLLAVRHGCTYVIIDWFFRSALHELYGTLVLTTWSFPSAPSAVYAGALALTDWTSFLPAVHYAYCMRALPRLLIGPLFYLPCILRTLCGSLSGYRLDLLSAHRALYVTCVTYAGALALID